MKRLWIIVLTCLICFSLTWIVGCTKSSSASTNDDKDDDDDTNGEHAEDCGLVLSAMSITSCLWFCCGVKCPESLNEYSGDICILETSSNRASPVETYNHCLRVWDSEWEKLKIYANKLAACRAEHIEEGINPDECNHIFTDYLESDEADIDWNLCD